MIVDFVGVCGFGEGDTLWSHIPPTGGGSLGDVMRSLADMRRQALQRRYVVEDFLTWGLPIITRLFLFNRTVHTGSPERMADCVTKLNGMRQNVITQVANASPPVFPPYHQ
jgi:hypothetical protein